MSEARMNAKVAASSTVVQALTCLASALPGISDSEDNMEDALDGSGGGSGRGGGGRQGARELAASALASAGPQSSSVALGGGGGVGVGGCVVKTEALPQRGSGVGGGVDPAAVKREEGDSAAAVAAATQREEGDSAAAVAAATQQQQPPVRRRSRAINDVVTNFSIDRALEQLKSDEGRDDDDNDPDGEAAALTRKGNRQRASVYVLMHAIAAVDTANDEAWDGDEEPLEGVEEATSAL
ncbi:unnamed protein product [Laminaria digitata]